MSFIKKLIFVTILFSLFSCWYVNEEKISENDSIDVQTFLSTPQIKPEELQTSEWISEEIETIRKEEISPPSNTPIKKKEDISSNEKPKTIEEIATIDTDIEIEDISIEVEDIIIEEVDEEAQIIEETTQEDIEELINILFETSDE